MADFKEIKPTLTKEWLTEQSQTKTITDIAKELGVFPMQLYRVAKKLGVPIRTRGEGISIGMKKTTKHPTRGKKRPEKTRLKSSLSHVRRYAKLSPSEKKRISQRGKVYWNALSDETKDNIREACKKGLNRAAVEGSHFENFIKGKLEKHGYIFDSHKEHQLVGTGRVHFDFFIPNLLTVIEVNGPLHYIPLRGMEKLQRTQKYDYKKYSALLLAGYIIIEIAMVNKRALNLTDQEIIWNELHKNLLKIANKLLDKNNRHIRIEVGL